MKEIKVVVKEVSEVYELPKWFIAFSGDVPIEQIVEHCRQKRGFEPAEVYVFRRGKNILSAVECQPQLVDEKIDTGNNP